MNVQPLAVQQAAAREALREYKQHRAAYDKRDWEIERIYRAIAKGKTVISVTDAIVRAGLDERGRPRLAISRADKVECWCCVADGEVLFSPTRSFSRCPFVLKWPEAKWRAGLRGLRAALPRIPPQHRPVESALPNYHLLWEADWEAIPSDPYLLRRIGRDAWVVVAAWDLTDVELSVLRAHEGGRP